MSEDVPEERCGFVLDPRDISENFTQHYEAGDEGWYLEGRVACCWRKVWSGVDTDHCIWHAEIDGKSVEKLIEARLDDSERLDGAHLREAQIGDSISFNNCRMWDADLTNADLEGTDFASTDLTDANFGATNLRDANFEAAHLPFANYGGADLRNVNLGSTNLFAADLTGANLNNTNLRDANLNGANSKGADLFNADLRGAILRYVGFRGADLRGTDFRGADLSEANLGDAALFGANFGNADLIETDFESANLITTRLTGANLERANFTGVNLLMADLGTAKLQDADLGDANLELADLTGTNLWRADLKSANLLGADLGDADLREADFGGADLTDADFGGADLREADFGGADLTDADFGGANLSETDLSDQNSQGINFTGANLTDADLTDANLRNADLKAATLENAVLTRTDLRGADLEYAELYQTLFSDIRMNNRTEFGETCQYEARDIEPQIDDGDSDVTPLEAAAWTYRRIQTLHEENALAQDAREYHVKKAEAYRKLRWREFADIWSQPHRDPWTWFTTLRRAATYSVNRRLSNHGEDPFQVLHVSLLVILISTVLYPLVGGIEQPPTPDGTTVVAFDLLPSIPIPLPGPIADLATSLYFSVVTFTTLGYGDLQPASGAAQALATVESFTGALLMALLVFVLGRRATW